MRNPANHNPGEILKAKTLPYLVIADEISRRFGSGNGGWMPTHRHLKTGGLYRVIARGRIEADLTPAVIYANKDGETWVRPEAEFNDGRFEALPPGATP